jgi:CRP/FNR family cyclic AMP-dependent transcriptional regulator
MMNDLSPGPSGEHDPDRVVAAVAFRQRLRRLMETSFRGAPTVTVPRGGHVYSCGARDRSIYFIEQGQIKTLTVSFGGKRCLLSIYTAGDVFGERGLLDGVRRETAVARERTVLRQIPGERFLDTVAAGGALEDVLTYFSTRVLEQQRIIVDMVTMTSERRLAARLLHLASNLGTRRGAEVHIDARLTQEELAEMVGTTRSRVGFFLKRFREAGLVEFGQRSTLVVDDAGLADYVDREAA